MQSPNKYRIARLTALTLLFSYAEMLLPRIIPFFRLGLGNIAVLMAFELPPLSFLLLTVIKAAAASLMSGTLFSPFFLISLSQSVASGFVMYGLFYLNRIGRNRLLSVYGISVSGSSVSAVVQIFLTGLYLGRGTWSLLGPMLLFNMVTGILTAAASTFIEEGESLPLAAAADASSAAPSTGRPRNAPSVQLLKAVLILTACCAVFFINNLYILAAVLVIAFASQLFCRRPVHILPHVSMWLFVILSSLFIPCGKVLFSFWNFSITEGALLSGMEKALKLSAASAFSQCAASLEPPRNTLLGLSLSYYRQMLAAFRQTEGNLLVKTKAALKCRFDE